MKALTVSKPTETIILPTMNLKTHPELDEKWVQEQIERDPEILGLGPLTSRDRERRHPGRGRLDMLFQDDSETPKRYEVELQLGAVDPSHIIRVIEYWDIERRKYPNYKHTAVLIAEDVTSRFLNVISLLNGSIPLILLKMTAYHVGEKIALTFVKVLDEVTLGLDFEDEPTNEPANRDYWISKSSEGSLSLLEEDLLKIIKEVEPSAELRYQRHYIGLTVGNRADNFVSFVPQRTGVVVRVKLQFTDDITSSIQEKQLNMLAYNFHFRCYQIRVENAMSFNDKQRDLFKQLFSLARTA